MTNVAGSDEEIKIDHIVVNVPPVPPTAAFTADVTEGDAPLSVQFTDQSTGDTPLTYAWDFENDGTVDSTEQNPSYTYSTPGTYSVSLTVTNVAGSDEEVKIDHIVVNVPPVPPTAAFTADVTEGDAPLSVQFTDQSTGDTPLTYAWDFDNDGTVDSTEQSPSFTYDTPGTYSVSLIVTNAAGSDTEVKTDYITVNVPPVPPTAEFTADVTEGDAPLAVQFTDQSTGDSPLTYAWDFENDGTVDSTDQNPSFIYNVPGIYTVSLMVTNLAGSDDEVKTDYITVSVPPIAPTADFTADLTSGDAPLTVQFTDLSTGDMPMTYAWDFENDGTVDSTEQNPAWTYDIPGIYTVSLTVTNVAGSDSEVKSDYIMVNVPPVPPMAAFTADVTSGDAPLSVQFTDQSTGDTPFSYAWDFENDGTVDSTEQNPAFTYDTPGMYTVSLTVTNIAGSDDEVKTDYITVNIPPVAPTADFTADVTEGDAPLTVQFTDQSTGDTPLSYAWDFENDGTVDSTEQNPAFIYNTPGIYTVSLTVANIAGSDDEVKTDYITVNVPPVAPTADFTADVTEGDAPLAVQFTDLSTGDTPLTYAWDFNSDGTVDSAEQNPSHVYDIPGIYTVSLTITNIAGSDDEVKTDYITVNVPPVAPAADFMADVTSGDAPLTVQFTDLSTGDTPMTYAWDFESDGTVDSTAQNPSHVYETPGIYTVSLTVTNIAGSDDEVKTDYITVNVPPVAPTAAFTADITEGDAPLTAQFTDQSTGDTPMTYAWDFENDGTVDSTEQNPAFIYNSPGVYTVSLTVTNIAGSDDEVKTDFITVNVPPVAPTADFIADVTSGDAPLSVQFMDQSTGDTPMTYAWDFENDGTIDSTEQNPAFTYDMPGIYTVSLTITNIAGSDDEVKSDYITVNVPPVAPTADFTADVTSGDAPLAVQFTDLSTGDSPLSWAWDFENDGTVDSTDQNPSFVYDVPGTYTVSLAVTNIAGSDSEVKADYITVTVPPIPPTAVFTADVTEGDAPLTVQFTDQSTGDSPLSWAWDFENDGTIDSTEQNPAFIYNTPGVYTVSLTVTNVAGIDDVVKTDYITVTVPPVAPTAAFTADVTSGNAPLTVQFTDQSMGDTPLTYAWDFETDGTVDSTEQNPAWIYDTPGIYTVTLTVTNVAGSDAEAKTDYITVTAPAPVLTTIVVSPATAVLAVGSGRQFTATAFDESGLPMGGITFGWGSSDEGVGTVDAAGYFTALAAGTTTITASSGTVSGTAKATVTEAPGPVASITIVPDAAVLAAGKCLQFTATARDGNGVEIPGIVFDWSCSDETVGTVDENGLFTGVAPGTADVIASTGGCEASVTVEVTPEEPTAVPEFPSLAVPVGMLIGIVGVVFGLRGMGVRGRDGTEKK
ncbi:MAG: PKD domain-containing protein [Methanomicrobiaceae archaeon]|nr:PKD domain-containing protein [Methanomicrobiaceae archaeon]